MRLHHIFALALIMGSAPAFAATSPLDCGAKAGASRYADTVNPEKNRYLTAAFGRQDTDTNRYNQRRGNSRAVSEGSSRSSRRN